MPPKREQQPSNNTNWIDQFVWPDQLKRQAQLAQAVSKARVGKYLNEDALEGMDFSELGDYAEWAARYAYGIYLRSIRMYGQESLSHLCLPMDWQFELEHFANISTISLLRQALATSGLQHLHRIGEKSEQKIRRLLELWDTLPER
jgi:hypothetical protein